MPARKVLANACLGVLVHLSRVRPNNTQERQGGQEGQEGQEGREGRDSKIEDRNDDVPKLAGDALSPIEGYVLVGLMASLVLVLLERKRREQRRRAEDAAAEVAE